MYFGDLHFFLVFSPIRGPTVPAETMGGAQPSGEAGPLVPGAPEVRQIRSQIGSPAVPAETMGAQRSGEARSLRPGTPVRCFNNRKEIDF